MSRGGWGIEVETVDGRTCSCSGAGCLVALLLVVLLAILIAHAG